MSSSDAIALIGDDWTPWLTKAPAIVRGLGLCMAMAATKEASQITLSGNLDYPDLASNLATVADQGQNAFIEAHANMLKVASKANQMGRVDGIVDQLMDRFGDRNAEKSVVRLLNSLKSDVEACNDSGRRTKKDFFDWKKKTTVLRTSVISAQTEVTKEVGIYETAIGTASAQKDRVAIDLDFANENRQMTQEQYEESLKAQAAKEAQLSSYAAKASQFALATGFGMIGAMAGVGVASWQSANAAKAVSEAETIAEKHREVARKLDYGIKNLDIELEVYKKEKKGLDHLLNAIKEVLGMLNGLIANIVALIQFFETMNRAIEDMVEEHDSKLKSIADQSQDEDLQKSDFEDFYRSALMFKKHAVTVHSLASLYTKVITEIINPGFSNIIECSQYSSGDSAVVVARKSNGINAYFGEAESMCKQLSSQANGDLRLRISELERVQSRRKPRTKMIKAKAEAPRRGFRRLVPI